MGDLRYCVTLVHGTFAKDAPWTLPGSALRQTLEARLDGRVEFLTFAWDAKNDNDSRARATEELVKQVSGRIRGYPNAVHAVIAHSHGGNIVLRAAADPRIANGLSRLICMSTPYFVPTKRDIVTAAMTLIRGFLWFFGVTAAIYCLASQSVEFSRLMRRFGAPYTVAQLTIAAAAALIMAFILQRSQRRISAWVTGRQERRIEEITLPKLGPTPVLCIWAKGDEVLLGFRILDRLADLTLLLLRPMSVIAALVVAFIWLAPAGNEAVQKILPVFGYSFFLMIVWPFWPFAVLWEYAARLLGIAISYAVPLATVIMAATIITFLSVGTWIAAALLHGVLKLAPFGMNGWRFIDTFFLRIAPSPTPPGDSGGAAQEMTLPRHGLLHSSIYRNDEALQTIAAFIRAAPGQAR